MEKCSRFSSYIFNLLESQTKEDEHLNSDTYATTSIYYA